MCFRAEGNLGTVDLFVPEKKFLKNQTLQRPKTWSAPRRAARRPLRPAAGPARRGSLRPGGPFRRRAIMMHGPGPVPRHAFSTSEENRQKRGDFALIDYYLPLS